MAKNDLKEIFFSPLKWTGNFAVLSSEQLTDKLVKEWLWDLYHHHYIPKSKDPNQVNSTIQIETPNKPLSNPIKIADKYHLTPKTCSFIHPSFHNLL